MRIHTDLSPMHVINLVQGITGQRGTDRVAVGKIERHGSRTHRNGIELRLFGNGGRNLGYATDGNRGATWDEWGAFLSALFDADPTARVARVYADRDQFHYMTGERFLDPGAVPSDTHYMHKWEFAERHGAYGWLKGWLQRDCKMCSASVPTNYAAELDGMMY